MKRMVCVFVKQVEAVILNLLLSDAAGTRHCTCVMLLSDRNC